MGPTVRRVAAYLIAIAREALATPCDMLAIHILPDNNWSATVKNLQTVINKKYAALSKVIV